ncbi:amidohydrolase family protein [Draconibacterium sp. IB214405]|uniref:amidohydrolase family protein n=1 Tax=Draconibacterium sp. IB214405 TaxID=3097352 RepID=UPI002A13DAA0|nr:amidohydrolase family protein [Draconibacterium sp. IB214405]MDX8338255.1 amidohydrolase family protein [Draconibacterium sp. IB214405]
MRKIAATYVFPGTASPIKNGNLVCDDAGTIIDILDRGDSFREEAGVEFYSGILVPGFVNAHCHLEFSHLHNKIEKHNGFSGFLEQINRLRDEPADKEKAMQIADRKMWAAGIAAVGDVSNSELSLSVKQKSKNYYHTFVEVFGFHPSRAERAFTKAVEVVESFENAKLSASLGPHSPYSVSQELFEKVKNYAEQKGGLFCIHNQESTAETEFFLSGSGDILTHFRDNLKLETTHWKPSGKSSLQSILQYLPKENQLLLVHNTHTKISDIEALKQDRDLANTYFVLCPNSNLYIQNELPPVDLLRNEDLQICLGTDSLASNTELSILKEMLTIQQNFPDVSLEELISWSGFNGAKALNITDTFGSFEEGKKPGVNLITGIDFKTMKLTTNAKVKRLI